MTIKNDKVRPLASVVAFVKDEKKKGKKIVTTNGCFDILHVGHVRSLTAAKALGDVLVVGINSDASVRALKGKDRPVVSERERAEIVASLKPVDAVFIFGEQDPRKWLAKVKPDFHAKGSDRKMEEIVEKDVVERAGGKIVLLSLRKGKSTTNLIKKIKKTVARDE
jgi:rfaE bifunctional protein nucleotidyltransferase chain/domain